MTNPPLDVRPSGIKHVGTSSLVLRAFVRNGLKIIGEIRPIVDQIYNNSYFENMKFVRIGILFLYGIKTDLTPQYERIDRTYKDLPIAIELDTEIMRWADQHNLELMKEIFLIATCEGVLHVLRKYKLPTEPIEQVRAKLGDIPLTIQECESWVQKTPLTVEALVEADPSGDGEKES